MSISFVPRRTVQFFGVCIACISLFCLMSPWALGQVVINEVHYEPENKTEFVEFIEIYNAGETIVDIGGWYFSDGVTFTFPIGSAMSPESFVVLVEDEAAFKARFSVQPSGIYQGRLANEGERLVLRDAAGQKVDEVEYKLGFPWPNASAGDGNSMELIHPSLDNDLGGSWRASGYTIQSGEAQGNERIDLSNGLASQSSTGWGGEPEFAIDGNTDGVFSNGSVTHTLDEASSWWQVLLPERHQITHITLFNRTDSGLQTRLTDFRLSVYDGGAEVFGQNYHTAGTNVAAFETFALSPGGVIGDRIRVQLLSTGILSLAEVVAYNRGDEGMFLKQQSSGWLYRKGISAPSAPGDAWRNLDFVTDASWLDGQTSIGYGDGDDNTEIVGMRDQYWSIYMRKIINIPNENALAPLLDGTGKLRLRIYVDDGCIVWINGVEIQRFHVTAGDKAFDSSAENHDAAWEDYEIPNPVGLLNQGDNILAIHVMNSALASSDLSIDAELYVEEGTVESLGAPTPGRRNSVYSEKAPPQIRQVEHSPLQPSTTETLTVTAKITDPDGVNTARVLYQIVSPGAYIPAWLPLPHDTLLASPNKEFQPNPDFEDPARWLAVAMRDDGTNGDKEAGDTIFTAVLPVQPENRTLIRYRIVADDLTTTSVRAPYEDDPSLNFAAYVYNGVPGYVTTDRSVHPEGVGHVYDPEMLTKLPVYSLVTRSIDYSECIAYNYADQISGGNTEARSRFNWEGAFVYEGYVYDHMLYRLRQRNDRYGGYGKRSMRLRFQRGNYLRVRDNYGNLYPTRWRTLNTGKMFDNKDVGNFGLTETINSILWNMTGVPAPYIHTFHMRVVKGAEETPTGSEGQYYGDFQGMYLAFEDYDARFLDSHHMEDGNLYKLKGGTFDGIELRRNQGRYATTTDDDMQNIRFNCSPEQSDEWLNSYVKFDEWYPYHTVVEAVRHYDFRPADSHFKNRAWYFEPDYSSNPFGKLWVLPHDSDASWGPNWNEGIDYPKAAIYDLGGKPAFKQEYRNVIREFRDLLWTPEAIHLMIDDLANLVRDFSYADRDRWRGAPSDAGYQDFGSLDTKVNDMKKFAFVSWTGNTGPSVPQGGRARHLDNLANAEGDSTNMPYRPVIMSRVSAGFPINSLSFQTSDFSDLQGTQSFAAMKWRVGEFETTYTPEGRRRKYEYEAVWESPDITTYVSTITLPVEPLKVGHTYRIRVKMKDNTNRWSHWSPPFEFTTGEPDNMRALQDYLRISELMYDPADGSDYEFVELHNIHAEIELDLTGVSFTSGIDYTIPKGTILQPLGYLVLTSADPTDNFAAFRAYYSLPNDVQILGPYEGKFDNAGERVTLKTARAGTDILTFEYDSGNGWPRRARAEGGCSLEPHDLLAMSRNDFEDLENWRASADPNGSPGRAGTGLGIDVVINEVLTHTDEPLTDTIELHNRAAYAVNISGWYLSDSVSDYYKLRIPEGTILFPGGYVVFTEADFNPTPLARTAQQFALNGAHGDEVILVATDAEGYAVRIVDHVLFGAAANGESFGRWPDGTGGLYPMISRTLGFANSGPRVGPVIISEIHYHPTTSTLSASSLEFIEIFNPTAATVDLTGWLVREGVSYDFTTATELAAGEVLVLISFDPAASQTAQAFRDTYGIGPGVRLVGPFSGSLSNGGETIRLHRPDAPPLDEPGFNPSLIEDEVRYDDDAPWPVDADGTGDSLMRLGADLYGNDPANWYASVPTPGIPLFEPPATTPTITCDLPAHFSAGRVHVVGLTAEGEPPPVMQVAGLPSWMQFDGNSYLAINAKRQQIDEVVTITVTATNKAGSDIRQFVIRITDPSPTMWVLR